MILLPTRNRVVNLKRFIAAYRETKATAKVLLILDPDDYFRYDDLDLPDSFDSMMAKTAHSLKDAMNRAVEIYPNESYYGVGADDFIPRVQGWDAQLIEAAGKHNVAWCDDGIHQDRLCTHPYIGGDLVRAWGWFVPPYIRRGYADFIWRDFARALGVEKYIPQMLCEHMHWQVNKAPYDTTYATQPSVAADKKSWEEYRVSEQFKNDVQSVKGKLGL